MVWSGLELLVFNWAGLWDALRSKTDEYIITSREQQRRDSRELDSGAWKSPWYRRNASGTALTTSRSLHMKVQRFWKNSYITIQWLHSSDILRREYASCVVRALGVGTLTFLTASILPFLDAAPCKYCHAPCFESWCCIRRTNIEYCNVHTGSCWIKHFHAVTTDSWRGQGESPGTCVSILWTWSNGLRWKIFISWGSNWIAVLSISWL